MGKKVVKTRSSALLEASRLIDVGGWLDPQVDELARDAKGKPVDLATGHGVQFGMYGALWTALGPMINCGQQRCQRICTCEIYASGLDLQRIEKFLDRFTENLGPLPGGSLGTFICTSYLYWESQVAETKQDVIRFFRAASASKESSKQNVRRAAKILLNAGFSMSKEALYYGSTKLKKGEKCT